MVELVGRSGRGALVVFKESSPLVGACIYRARLCWTQLYHGLDGADEHRISLWPTVRPTGIPRSAPSARVKCKSVHAHNNGLTTGLLHLSYARMYPKQPHTDWPTHLSTVRRTGRHGLQLRNVRVYISGFLQTKGFAAFRNNPTHSEVTAVREVFARARILSLKSALSDSTMTLTSALNNLTISKKRVQRPHRAKMLEAHTPTCSHSRSVFCDRLSGDQPVL